MAEKFPDWLCPNVSCVNSTNKVFGSKANCPKCGSMPGRLNPNASSFVSAASQGGGNMGAQSFEEEDWQCPNISCVNNVRGVFRKKASCPACGSSKHAKSPGDWQCPNSECVNSQPTHLVFNSKPSCPKCGVQRPGSGGAAPWSMQNQAAPWGMQNQAAAWSIGYGGAAMNLNGADWICPTADCVNAKWMVFGKNSTCPKCGVARPMSGDNPGDWNCPNSECVNAKNKVFAKHSACPKCGTANPTGACGRGRSRSPRR